MKNILIFRPTNNLIKILSMNIGIPMEVSQQELRVGATPKTVQRLQKQGFTVFIEKEPVIEQTMPIKSSKMREQN